MTSQSGIVITQVKVSMSMIRVCIMLIRPPFGSHTNICNVSINYLSFLKLYTDTWHFIQESCVSYIRFHCTDFWHLTFSYTFQCHLSGSVPVNGNDRIETGSDSDLLNFTHTCSSTFSILYYVKRKRSR